MIWVVKAVVAVLALASAFPGNAMQPEARHGQRGQRGYDSRDWTEGRKQEGLEFLAKVYDQRVKQPEPGPENIFLHLRASELIDRMKQPQANNFQFDRLFRATDSLLRASERIMQARKNGSIDDDERRDAALFLQRCYFRVQQAEYFAGVSGEKEAKQYVSHTRGLYQQARSAYDAHQYSKARMLGDASSLIAAALENIAQASLRIPDPPIIK